eukprot:scaffold11667_cov127-Isochrysis_galbana.AAC.6
MSSRGCITATTAGPAVAPLSSQSARSAAIAAAMSLMCATSGATAPTSDVRASAILACASFSVSTSVAASTSDCNVPPIGGGDRGTTVAAAAGVADGGADAWALGTEPFGEAAGGSETAAGYGRLYVARPSARESE